MNPIKYENTHYDEAEKHSQKYSKTKEDECYKINLTGKNDQIQTQQNNIIIALLTSLHYRLTVIENKLLILEQQISGTNISQS